MHILSRRKYLKHKAPNPYLYQYFESEQYLFAFIQLSCIKYL